MKLHTLKSRLANMGVTVAATCGVLGGLGGWVALSVATELRSEQNAYYIPYQGQLDLGGQPVDGQTDFVFSLYDAPDADTPIWVSDTRTVQVSSGYFAVVLGDQSDAEPIDASIMGRDALYVGMSVDGVALDGRQRLLGTPFAQNAAPGKIFMVDGPLRAFDGAQIDGNTAVQALSASAGATIAGGPTQVQALSASGQITGTSGANIQGRTDLANLVVPGNKLESNLAEIKRVSVPTRIVTDAYAENSHYIGDTGYSTANWNCVLGGFDYGNGDIYETDRGPLASAYTYEKDGNWWVRMHFRHHRGGMNNVRADVLCLQKNISTDRR